MPNPYQTQLDSLSAEYKSALEEAFSDTREVLAARIEASSLPVTSSVWDPSIWGSALEGMVPAVEKNLREAMQFWLEEWGLEQWPDVDPEAVDREFDAAAVEIFERLRDYEPYIRSDVDSSVDRFSEDKGRLNDSLGLVAVGGSLYESREQQIGEAESNFTFFAAARAVSRGTSYEPDKIWGCSFSNSRAAHEDADGQRVPFNGFFNLDGEVGAFPGDFSAKNSINCLLGDTPVGFRGGDILAATKSSYSGPVITLTVKGREIRCTPNHPFATPSGWVAAKDLDVGSEVFEDIADLVAGQHAGHPNPNEVPASAEQVFALCEMVGQAERLIGSGDDFHGDVTDGDIDVVNVGGLLQFASEVAGDGSLVPTDPAHTRVGSGDQAVLGVTASASRGMSVSDVRLTFSGSHLGDPIELTLGTVALSEPLPLDPEHYRGSADPEEFCDFLNRHSVPEMKIANVSAVQVDTVNHEPVYDFQTTSGHYTAGSVLVHNCQCWVQYDENSAQRNQILAGWNEEEPEPGMTIEVGDVADLSDIDGVFDFFEFSTERNTTMNITGIAFSTSNAGRDFLVENLERWMGVEEFSQPDFSDGIIFSLEPDDETRALIAEHVNVTEESIHMTIAFYGDRADTDEDFEEAFKATGEAVAESFPDGLRMSLINGPGQFYSPDGDFVCHVLLVDGPDLPELHNRVVRMSKERGLEPSETHGFTPHITTSWDSIPEVEPLIGVELAFNSLSARFGTELLSFPFGSSPTQGSTEASQMSDPRPDLTVLDKIVPADDNQIVVEHAIEVDTAPTTTINVFGGGIKICEDGQLEVMTVADIAPTPHELQNNLPEGGRMPSPEAVVPSPVVAGSETSVDEETADAEAAVEDAEETSTEEAASEEATEEAETLQPLAKVVESSDPSFTPAPSSKVLDAAPAADEVTATAVVEADAEDAEEFMDEPGTKDGAEWTGVIIVEGIESGDGRKIAEGALGWRDLPLPLMLQTENQPGHSGSVICGSITALERVGQDIVGYGKFDSGEAGQEARRLLGEGTMRGVSADIDMAEIEWEIPEAEIPDGDVTEDELLDLLYDDRAIMVLIEGRIMGATLTPFPAFQEAYVEVLEVSGAEGDGENQEAGVVASGSPSTYVWRQHGATSFTTPDTKAKAMVASAGEAGLRSHIPEVPPAEWFAQAETAGAYPVTVEVDGQIHGYAAQWGSCHIGFADHCEPVPTSSCAYALFRTGNTQVRTDSGDKLVATGPIFAETNHPDLYASAADAYSHYADTGTAVADVVVFEDAYGIQVRGAVRPSATSDQIRALRGADISPDWRPDADGHLECVALLAVNCSGFLVPGLVASAGRARGSFDVKDGRVKGLVAAGMLRKATHKFDALQAQIVTMGKVLMSLADAEKERDLAARKAAVLAQIGAVAPVEAAASEADQGDVAPVEASGCDGVCDGACKAPVAEATAAE